MAKASNETAWKLDDERVAVAADGGTIAGLPGLWKPGVAYHADAFGMNQTDFADLVDALDLPLVKVSVKEGSALRAFERPTDGRLSSAPTGVPIGVQDVENDQAADVDETLDQVDQAAREAAARAALDDATAETEEGN